MVVDKKCIKTAFYYSTLNRLSIFWHKKTVLMLKKPIKHSVHRKSSIFVYSWIPDATEYILGQHTHILSLQRMYMHSDWSIEILEFKISQWTNRSGIGSIWVYWQGNGLKHSHFQITYNFVQYTIVDQQKKYMSICSAASGIQLILEPFLLQNCGQRTSY